MKPAVRARSGRWTNVTRHSRTEPVPSSPIAFKVLPTLKVLAIRRVICQGIRYLPRFTSIGAAVHGQDALGLQRWLDESAHASKGAGTASNATEERDREIPHRTRASRRHARDVSRQNAGRLGLVAAGVARCAYDRQRRCHQRLIRPHVPLSLRLEQNTGTVAHLSHTCSIAGDLPGSAVSETSLRRGRDEVRTGGRRFVLRLPATTPRPTRVAPPPLSS